jgi:2-keto-4-pentenoate hydratase/2-oxohepta-3-ene-1,7-dioic acid hydratase in catechol pathway
MKIIRYKYKEKVYYGTTIKDEVYVFEDFPFLIQEDDLCNNIKATGLDLHDIELLPPVVPQKIIAVAENYVKSSSEKVSLEPIVFLKAPNALTLSKKVFLPFDLKTWGESELAFVISKDASKISIEDAGDHIFGYLAANDVTSTNIEGRDHHLARSKSADGFCPLGSYIDTAYDYKNKSVRSWHNGIKLREASTDDLIWSPERIIYEVSKWMTLNSGDLVLTGAPPRVRDRMYLQNSDRFCVDIEGLESIETEFYSG